MPALWFRRKPFPPLKSQPPISPRKRRKNEKPHIRKPLDAPTVHPPVAHAMAVVRNRGRVPTAHAVNGELNPNDVLPADLLKDLVDQASVGSPRGRPGAANRDLHMAAPNVVVNDRQAEELNEARKAVRFLHRRIPITVDPPMVQPTQAPVARMEKTPVPVTVTTEAMNSAPAVLDSSIVHTRVGLEAHVVHSADLIVTSVSTADLVAGISDHSLITQTTDISDHRRAADTIPVATDITLDTDTVTTSERITADQNAAAMVISDLRSVDHTEVTSVAMDITRDTDMATVLEHITVGQNTAIMVISGLHLVDHTEATSEASDHAVGMNTVAISDHSTAIAGILDPHTLRTEDLSGISGHAADNSTAVIPVPSLADPNANIVATSDHVTIQADNTMEMGSTMDAIAIITLVRVGQVEDKITWDRVPSKTADVMPVHTLADQNKIIAVNLTHIKAAPVDLTRGQVSAMSSSTLVRPMTVQVGDQPTWDHVVRKTAVVTRVHTVVDRNRNIVVNSLRLAVAQAGSAVATWDRAMEMIVDPVLVVQVEWDLLKISQVADGVDSRHPVVPIANQDAMSGRRRMDGDASRGHVMNPAVMSLAANVYATRDDA